MAARVRAGSLRSAVGPRVTRVARVGAALVLLAGLAGAASHAATRETLSTFSVDLAAGRVAEVVFVGPRGYPAPGLTGLDSPGATVRWTTTDGSRRVAGLAEGIGSGWPGEVDRTDGSGPDGTPTTEAEVERVLRDQVAGAGVPLTSPGGDWSTRAARASVLGSLLLVLVLVFGPQPRRATKWAWFWLMLVPGGLVQLVWLAVEAPWSRRIAAVPEPRAHQLEPADTRLTGGRAVLLTCALTILVGLAGQRLAGWLAG